MRLHDDATRVLQRAIEGGYFDDIKPAQDPIDLHLSALDVPVLTEAQFAELQDRRCTHAQALLAPMYPDVRVFATISEFDFLTAEYSNFELEARVPVRGKLSGPAAPPTLAQVQAGINEAWRNGFFDKSYVTPLDPHKVQARVDALLGDGYRVTDAGGPHARNLYGDHLPKRAPQVEHAPRKTWERGKRLRGG